MCGDALGHNQRGDLVEIDAAVLLRNVGAQQAEAAAFLHQLSLQGPVFLLQAIVDRYHLAVDELRRRLPDQFVFLGQLFGSHHRGRIGLPNQPCAAFYCRFARYARHTLLVSVISNQQSVRYRRSKMPAAPMPPPTHIVTMPYLALRRCISLIKVAVSFAPVQPSGWPSAMAPPLTLTFSGSRLSSFMHARACAAKASLSSIRSI